MKKIPLSQGKRRPSTHKGFYALVDDDDYEWLNQWNWTAILTNRKCGGYATRVEYGTTILMHRLIMGATNSEEVDHEDGQGLNNQRYNLRKATRAQGIANRGKFSNNKSGYKGVQRNKKNGKWKLSITAQYDTPEEAARAYDQCASLLFGEFARLNFPITSPVKSALSGRETRSTQSAPPRR